MFFRDDAIENFKAARAAKPSPLPLPLALYLSFHLARQLDGGVLPFLEGPLPPVGVPDLKLPSVEPLSVHL